MQFAKFYTMQILQGDYYQKGKTNPMVEFETELFLERSITPHMEPLGMAKNKMHFFGDYIIWEIEYADGSDDEVVIGLGIEGKKVMGYDGVMCIPKEAVEMLRLLGYYVSEIE